jgi:uncharacterized protein YbbC (DUF1343 family)
MGRVLRIEAPMAMAIAIAACTAPSTPTAPPRSTSAAPNASTAEAPAPEPAPSTAGPPVVASLTPEIEAQIAASVDRGIAAGDYPGAVVLVVRDGQVLLRRAWGARRVEPVREPMTTDTVFDLASLTKPIATATSILALVERGALALDDPVARHLPSFGQAGKDRITVAELLAHTAGLPADNDLRDYRGGAAAALAAIDRLAPVSPPGDKRVYSDVGYIVLGELVERIGGERLDRFAASLLFEPLAMHDTAFVPSPALAARAAPTEERDGAWLVGRVHDPRAAALGGVAGHAGLFSTADDLGRFAAMLLAGGVHGGKRILASDTVAALFRPVAGTEAALAFKRHGRAFFHDGFTGTYLWLDPATRTALVVLTSRLHPRGKGDAARIRRELRAIVEALPAPVATGIEALEAGSFAALRGQRIGLVANDQSRTADGRRTVDVLRAAGIDVAALFAPEHGLDARIDGDVPSGRDDGVPIHSLFGASKRPTAAQLAPLDTIVFDLQDAGVRFYTYETTLGYVLEAAGAASKRVVVLDRPNPLGGLVIEGPLLDAARESFTGYHPLPVRHGLTLGELGRLFVAERHIQVDLEVVPLRGWRRDMLFADTLLPWRAPSPNLRTPTAALLYPGIALFETSNLSVGRGTDLPFERLGAPWLDAGALAAAVAVPGVRITAESFTPESSTFARQLCQGLRFEVTDPRGLRSVDVGVAIAVALRRLHRKEWRADRFVDLLGDSDSHGLLLQGIDAAAVTASWRRELDDFATRRAPYLLY